MEHSNARSMKLHDFTMQKGIVASCSFMLLAEESFIIDSS